MRRYKQLSFISITSSPLEYRSSSKRNIHSSISCYISIICISPRTSLCKCYKFFSCKC
nr:MAG TPA: hypothetical protein [Caudoviricetes sp.]